MSWPILELTNYVIQTPHLAVPLGIQLFKAHKMGGKEYGSSDIFFNKCIDNFRLFIANRFVNIYVEGALFEIIRRGGGKKPCTFFLIL